MAEPKELETTCEPLVIAGGDVFTIAMPEHKTYRLKPHNIRTFSDLQDMLGILDLRYTHWSGEDRAAKLPHLWEREE